MTLYLRLATRRLLKNRVFTALNILGLTPGSGWARYRSSSPCAIPALRNLIFIGIKAFP